MEVVEVEAEPAATKVAPTAAAVTTIPKPVSRGLQGSGRGVPPGSARRLASSCCLRFKALDFMGPVLMGYQYGFELASISPPGAIAGSSHPPPQAKAAAVKAAPVSTLTLFG